MPIRVMTAELRKKQASRVLLFGAPNSWKTTSVIKTALYPLTILSLPGETGWATIPAGVNGLTSFVWEEAAGDPVTADSVRREIEELTFQIIAGKHGEVKTLCLDGLHKLYPTYLNVATGGAYGRGEDFEPAKYAKAHAMFERFVSRVLASPVPYIICTTWNAKEADVEGGKVGHQWPDLPGRMAKLIVGMFSVVVFAKVDAPMGPTGQAKGYWLLKPNSEVWGSSIKMDPRLVEKLPSTSPQDFRNLYKVVGAAEAELEAESAKP